MSGTTQVVGGTGRPHVGTTRKKRRARLAGSVGVRHPWDLTNLTMRVVEHRRSRLQENESLQDFEPTRDQPLIGEERSQVLIGAGSTVCGGP